MGSDIRSVRGQCAASPGFAVTWYSQAGQDEWVHSIIGDKGFFVDVGAYDGVEHSNTYALEQLGWKGWCIDADPSAIEACQRNRQCAVRWARVGYDDGTTRLSEILVKVPPRTIDYLSIDVEGMDLDVLRGHDFDRWPVRLITVEHNHYAEGPARKVAIFDYLTERGFKRVRDDVIAEGYGPYEDWYQHRDD